MDRSFLSRPEVIAASRRLVCVRLMTYESESEGQFMKSFNVTRSGELENSVFAILPPDGKKELVRAARSMRRDFSDAADMAASMNRIAKQYPAKAGGSRPELPVVANVRLAVDVAACDNRPLVVVYSPDANDRKALEDRLADLAWGQEFIGRFIFVVVSDAKDLGLVGGAEPGVLVVQPDKFGTNGTILKRVAVGALSEDLAKCLRDGATQFKRSEKDFGGHVRAGQLKGVFWETAIPVSDPQEAQARERGKRAR